MSAEGQPNQKSVHRDLFAAAAVVGGMVVTLVSRSALGVSGPAAGLTVIVLDAILILTGYKLAKVSVFREMARL